MISNATPLIYLAKIGKLELLKEFFGTIYIPEAVKMEVVDQGKKLNEPDAVIVENAIGDGWIIVKRVKTMDAVKDIGIDKGEQEAISLALEMKEEILLDQTHARQAAELMGLKPMGTIFVLFRALKKKKINYNEYLELLEKLAKAGFRMSQEVYLKAVKLGRF